MVDNGFNIIVHELYKITMIIIYILLISPTVNSLQISNNLLNINHSKNIIKMYKLYYKRAYIYNKQYYLMTENDPPVLCESY